MRKWQRCGSACRSCRKKAARYWSFTTTRAFPRWTSPRRWKCTPTPSARRSAACAASCANVFTGRFRTEASMPESTDPREGEVLIQKYVSGELKAEEATRLLARLKAQPSLGAALLEQMEIDILLRELT